MLRSYSRDRILSQKKVMNELTQNNRQSISGSGSGSGTGSGTGSGKSGKW